MVFDQYLVHAICEVHQQRGRVLHLVLGHVLFDAGIRCPLRHRILSIATKMEVSIRKQSTHFANEFIQKLVRAFLGRIH